MPTFPVVHPRLPTTVILALVTALFASPRSAAQIQPVPRFLPLNSAPIDYTGPSVSAHTNQRCNVFRPLGKRPAQGYPVVVQIKLGNFVSSKLDAEITPAHAFLWRCLTHGIAVVQATTTRPGDAPLGGSLFHPPGSDPNLGYEPYEHPGHHMAEKDAVMVVQHVRYQTGQNGVFRILDPDRIALHGSSAGAFCSHWVAFGRERGAQTFPGGSGQEQVSTSVDAAVVAIGSVWAPGHDFDTPNNHFPDALNPLQPAVDLGGVDLAVLEQASALWFDAGSPPPTLMTYSAPVDTPVYDPVFGGSYVLDSETDVHSSWSGFAWKKRHPQSTRLLLGSRNLAEDAGTHQGLHDVTVTDPLTRACEQLEWLRQHWGLSPWSDLGFALPDSLGVEPRLCAEGKLIGGGRLTLRCSNASPSAPAELHIGDDDVSVPHHGGILVPGGANSVVLYGQTDADGHVVFEFDVPLGAPSGGTRYYQVWTGSGGQWTATNALESITP